ncbi:hypothetical protein JOF56_010126 [Kibdelosporangium banguiense]|uniref:Uncharacterized protein n=1 Tax=Kibdelosporangium banguiense TaxID=1365924 RepID=A0ABS4U0Q2_9PSEU|nr:hypothetical protein [Kibdelosporangium banguiense]
MGRSLFVVDNGDRARLVMPVAGPEPARIDLLDVLRR